METQNEKYNELLSNLRRQVPKLDNPGKLTEQIMLSINKPDKNTFTKIIVVARPWLSAAAVFLIGLFIYQNTDVPFGETKTAPIAIVKVKPDKTDCLAELKNGKIDRKALIRSYQCYQKQSEQKTSSIEQLIMKYQHKL